MKLLRWGHQVRNAVHDVYDRSIGELTFAWIEV